MQQRIETAIYIPLHSITLAQKAISPLDMLCGRQDSKRPSHRSTLLFYSHLASAQAHKYVSSARNTTVCTRPVTKIRETGTVFQRVQTITSRKGLPPLDQREWVDCQVARCGSQAPWIGFCTKVGHTAPSKQYAGTPHQHPPPRPCPCTLCWSKVDRL
jgi:hypothetical protein